MQFWHQVSQQFWKRWPTQVFFGPSVRVIQISYLGWQVFPTRQSTLGLTGWTFSYPLPLFWITCNFDHSLPHCAVLCNLQSRPLDDRQRAGLSDQVMDHPPVLHLWTFQWIRPYKHLGSINIVERWLNHHIWFSPTSASCKLLSARTGRPGHCSDWQS